MAMLRWRRWSTARSSRRPAGGEASPSRRTTSMLRSMRWRSGLACPATSGSASSNRSEASPPNNTPRTLSGRCWRYGGWPMPASSRRPRKCSSPSKISSVRQSRPGSSWPAPARKPKNCGSRHSPPPTISGHWPGSTPWTWAVPAPTAGCSRSVAIPETRDSKRRCSRCGRATSRRWCKWPTNSSSSSARIVCRPPKRSWKMCGPGSSRTSVSGKAVPPRARYSGPCRKKPPWKT